MQDGSRSHDRLAPSVSHTSPPSRHLRASRIGTLVALAAATPLFVAFPAAHLLIAAGVAAVGVTLAVSYAGVFLALGLAARLARLPTRVSVPAFASGRPSRSTDEAPE